MSQVQKERDSRKVRRNGKPITATRGESRKGKQIGAAARARGRRQQERTRKGRRNRRSRNG